MSEGKFGEPWVADIAEQLADCPPTYRIFASEGGTYEDGDYVCQSSSRKLDARIVTCVNAFAGIEDPESALTRLRGIEEAVGFFLDVREHDCHCKDALQGDDYTCALCNLTGLIGDGKGGE